MFSNVILYWSVLLIGFLLGTFFKKTRPGQPPGWFKVLSPVQTAALTALIFVLGAGIGADDKVISSLSEIGFSAAVIALAGLSGSVFLTWIGRKLTGLDHEANRMTAPVAEDGAQSPAVKTNTSPASHSAARKSISKTDESGEQGGEGID